MAVSGDVFVGADSDTHYLQRFLISGVSGTKTALDLADEAANLTLSQDLKALLDKIATDGVTYQDKLDSIIKLNTRILPIVFGQLLSKNPNMDFANMATKVGVQLKDLSALIIKKREAELVDEINLNSPKYQIVFKWILDIFKDILIENDLSDDRINSIFSGLSTGLSGFEETCHSRLKGLSAAALAGINNPLKKQLTE